jgi:hypothetical protein
VLAQRAGLRGITRGMGGGLIEDDRKDEAGRCALVASHAASATSDMLGNSPYGYTTFGPGEIDHYRCIR